MCEPLRCPDCGDSEVYWYDEVKTEDGSETLPAIWYCGVSNCEAVFRPDVPEQMDRLRAANPGVNLEQR